MPEPADDPLEALRQRLEATRDAAARLAGEAASAGAEGELPPRARRPPPGGWAAPGSEPGEAPPSPELQALRALLELGRDSLPRELQQQVREALRELLQALRALLDWLIALLARPAADMTEVEEIPID